MDRAIEVLGGQKYLNIETVIGKGFYTTFGDGVSQLPARFLDYIDYPDRERTEFVGSGIRTIQTNDGETGWFFDGAVKKISDQTPTQVENFKLAMKTGLENLLRGWWKKEGGKITYVGRREAGLAKRNDDYPCNLSRTVSGSSMSLGREMVCRRRSFTNALEKILTQAIRLRSLKKIR